MVSNTNGQSLSVGDGAAHNGLTLTVLGCGTMGIAILSGILASLSDMRNGIGGSSSSLSGTSTPAEELPPRLPTRFIACVRREASAKRIRLALEPYKSFDISVRVNDNLGAAQEADLVLLCCKPQMFRDILSADGVVPALRGKLLMSICAGVTVQQLEDEILQHNGGAESTCRAVRVMPNTASGVRESMTTIANPVPALPLEDQSLITWIFQRIGRVVHLDEKLMDASTALCGSGPAFMALILEAIADGAVAMGIPRAEAQMMAAQTMRGTTGLVMNGEHPAILRDKVSTPGGCTIGGLLVLEEGRVRGTMARAVREATVVASQLGQGKQGVNGTRF